MDLTKQFLNYINSEKLFIKNDRLLLAVSGGVDSVVLCDLCFKAGFNFKIAHCNFKLRGEESEKDAELVKHLAELYSVEYFQKDFDTENYVLENKVSIQVAARELRYNWFDFLLKENHLNKVLTAHHANDNIETILMNLFKGTGIDGLRGILPGNGKICRPLLFATKDQIKNYAIDNSLVWREDFSNSSEKYTRNYFRNKLIPLLEESLPGFSKNMMENAERFRDIEILYDLSKDRILKRLIKNVNDEVHLPVEGLKNMPANQTILFEIVKQYGFNSKQLPYIMQLLYSETGKFIESNSHRIFKNRKWLIINSKTSEREDNIVIEKSDVEIVTNKFKLNISETQAPASFQNNLNIALLNNELIKFPLILRKWKQGDYFYPLGMKRKKKLSKFFIDKKLSISDKENIWVIESDKKIIWVVGQRIDERFKIQPQTKAVLKIKLIAE